MNLFNPPVDRWLHYTILLAALCSAGLSLYALVLCIRTPIKKRKWLWIIVTILGIGKLGIEWSSGELWHKILLPIDSAGRVGIRGGWSFRVRFHSCWSNPLPPVTKPTPENGRPGTAGQHRWTNDCRKSVRGRLWPADYRVTFFAHEVSRRARPWVATAEETCGCCAFRLMSSAARTPRMGHPAQLPAGATGREASRQKLLPVEQR